MRSIHLIAILLCVAMGVADAALAVHVESSVTPAFVMLAGMTFGQLTLLAVWCVSGTGPWVVRVLATLSAVAGLAALLAPATAASRSGWFVALGAYWLIATLGMWGIAATTRKPRQESGRARLQYSLSSLLSVTTLLSVLLAMTHWVCFSWPQLASFAPVGVWLVITAVVTMHVTATEQPAWMVAPIVVSIVAGMLLSRATGLYDAGFFTLLCLVQAATITVGMLVVQNGQLIAPDTQSV
jgi:hypothetical protein